LILSNPFFGRGDSHKKKYHLVKCDIIYLPKDQGGMGVSQTSTLKHLRTKRVALPFTQQRSMATTAEKHNLPGDL
jgi:hypothetical protein